MLVLSRKINEKILIGGNIEITIVDIKGDIVKVGINAPREVSILRGELLTEVEQATMAAAMSNTASADDLKAVEKLLKAKKKKGE
ncbi:carbon storage regulator CsrA [bacterium]|nr:carbon storage regulator CsrA [bacterium]MBU1025577.1 carbon storage regulator CsrA [bacterium]